MRKLQICRVCLETEDDSKGSAHLTPITNAVSAFLNLKEQTFPNMICTNCERIIVDCMVLIEMCEESNNFIDQVRNELLTETGFKSFQTYKTYKTKIINKKELIGTEGKFDEGHWIESSDNADENPASYTSLEERLQVVNDFEPTDKLCSRSPNMDKKKNTRTYKMMNDKYACIFCGKLCDTKHSHSTHVKISHTRPHKCPVKGCTKAFGLPTMVRRHMNQMHSDREEKLIVNQLNGSKIEISMSRQESGKFHCFYCGEKKKFNRQCYLENHIRKVHENASLECNVCGKVFNENRLKIHMKIHKKVFVCVNYWLS